MPVLFGPNNKHFVEAQGLLQSGGGIEIEDYETFSLIMSQLSDGSAYYDTCGQEAGAFVQSLAGATKKVLSSVKL